MLVCASVFLGAVPFIGQAVAQDSCVRVAVFETRGEKESADPAFMTDTGDAAIVRSLFEPLVHLDTNFEPVPVLAESWEASDGARTWTFHLRRGVKFHDGRDFTAKDVVYTYRRLIDPQTGSAAASDLTFLEPDGIEAVDDYTVRFTAKQPIVEMPILLSTKFALIIPDGTTSEALNTHPVGTGPFALDRFVPNQAKRVFQRNQAYWQAGLPKAQCIEITPATEPMTRMAALLSGQIDLDLGVDPTSVPTLQASPGVTLKGSSAGGYALSLVMWVDTPPFDNVKVRQALKLVVDREAMVQSALLGFGEFGNDNPVPPTRNDAFRADPIPRDVEKAKQLLAEAGYEDGLEVDLFTAKHFPGIDQMGQAYAQMAAEAGIKVNVINTPVDSYWDDVWLKRAFSTTYLGPRPTPSALSLTLRSTSDWNETHWFRPDYDALLDEASATVDPDARRKLYQQAQQMLAEEGGMITPIFAGVVAGLREGCTGYEPHIDTNRLDLKTLTCQ